MKTIIYLIRHSEPFKNRTYLKSKDSLQLQNEKNPLTYNGELKAKKLSKLKELKNIDKIFSSNYVRTISTAKYIAESNNKEVLIIDDLGERKIGITSWDEYPTDFEKHQFEDENYKIGNGESQKETKERLYKALMEIINENKGKRIVIVCHSTAMMYLFSSWCEVKYSGDYSFKEKVFFDGKWDYLETFKLIFEDYNLNEIKKIE
ncbi:MAG: histidine phosphatase family protein [Clostridia bacterium]